MSITISFEVNDAYEANIFMAVEALMNEEMEVWYSYNHKGLLCLLDQILPDWIASQMGEDETLGEEEIRNALDGLRDALSPKKKIENYNTPIA